MVVAYGVCGVPVGTGSEITAWDGPVERGRADSTQIWVVRAWILSDEYANLPREREPDEARDVGRAGRVVE